ncbi:MAG: type II toxin-antitoxin system RelE/ParE family toxin [Planctomycetes bacterium]|nr:type II toxin-antitoxin system RelE/ParE family toxin [Planctomycetota bacterium]
MKYKVTFTFAIQKEIDSQIGHFINEKVPSPFIEQWLAGLLERLDSLSEFPSRCPVSNTYSSIKQFEVRRLIYGEYAPYYRINSEQRIVEILSLRHGRRKGI